MTARWPLVLNGSTIQELQSGDTLNGIPSSGFDSGTAIVFVQSTAPTGWTKQTAYNDYALRVVSGTASTGGSVAFSSAFASQTPSGSINTSGLSVAATTLNTSQIPGHNHGSNTGAFVVSGNASSDLINNAGSGPVFSLYYYTGSTGGGGSHTHPLSGSASFTGSAIDLGVKYIDTIICTKN